MSISNPRTGETNPAQKFIEFKGSTGKFQYWDKQKEENVEVSLPIEFVVCDELSKISGYNKQNKCGIYSNEVHDTISEEMTVKYFKGGMEIAKGIYQDIKDKITSKSVGGRYAKSVYAVLNGELVNFTFTGSPLSAWIEKEVGFTQPKFIVKETKEETNGSNTYQVPIFEAVQSTEEEWAEAIDMDKEVLQPYLESKNVVRKEVEEEGTKTTSPSLEVSTEPTDGAEAAEQKADLSDEKEEKINIDDLPF